MVIGCFSALYNSITCHGLSYWPSSEFVCLSEQRWHLWGLSPSPLPGLLDLVCHEPRQLIQELRGWFQINLKCLHHSLLGIIMGSKSKEISSLLPFVPQVLSFCVCVCVNFGYWRFDFWSTHSTRISFWITLCTKEIQWRHFFPQTSIWIALGDTGIHWGHFYPEWLDFSPERGRLD